MGSSELRLFPDLATGYCSTTCGLATTAGARSGAAAIAGCSASPWRKTDWLLCGGRAAGWLALERVVLMLAALS